MRGMIGLYEASQLGIAREDIVDEAGEFSGQFLCEKNFNVVNPNIARFIRSKEDYMNPSWEQRMAVESWLVDKAVLPIQSSVGWSIHRNYDLLLGHKLHIIGEVQLLINHYLLGLPGVRKKDLRAVMSHP
ncbi:hypothetical protein JHK87_033677 [Glycine soja]|nr:hypothetical protein JHK87_033677 [Glycine soja]